VEVEVSVDRLMPGEPMTPWLVADKEPEAAYGCGTAGGWQIIRHSSRARLTPANRLNTRARRISVPFFKIAWSSAISNSDVAWSLLRSATRNPNCWMVLCCKE
jgi:hypothetical protein